MQVIKAAAGIIKQEPAGVDRRCSTKGRLSLLDQKINMLLSVATVLFPQHLEITWKTLYLQTLLTITLKE